MPFQRWTPEKGEQHADEIGLVRVMIHLYDPTPTRTSKKGGKGFPGKIKKGCKAVVFTVDQASVRDVQRTIEVALFGEGG